MPGATPAALALLLVLVGCSSRDGTDSQPPEAVSAEVQQNRHQGAVLNNRAALFLKAGSLLRARNTLQQAIELAPDLPDAHFNLGLTEARLGHHAEATVAFGRAAELGFASVDFDVARGMSLRAQNRYAEAAAAFDAALQQAPGRADLHLHRGEVLRAMGTLDSALAAFDVAIGLDSSLASAWRYRGELLAAAGSQADAATAYSRAVELDSVDISALVGQAEALRRLERYTEAEAALQTALAHEPRASRVWYVLARVAEAAGQTRQADEARHVFQRLTEARRHFDQGQVYARRGQFADADAELSRATEVDSAFAEAWLRLGALRLEHHQPDSAMVALQYVATHWPDHPEVNNLRGEALLQLADLDGAILAFGATLRNNPGSIPARLGIGRAHFAASRFDAARTEFRQVHDLSPDESEAYYFLGLILAHEGQLRDAITTLEQCLELRPGHVEAHYHLGRILAASGDVTGARSHLQQALSLRPGHERASDHLARLDQQP